MYRTYGSQVCTNQAMNQRQACGINAREDTMSVKKFKLISRVIRLDGGKFDKEDKMKNFLQFENYRINM